MAGMITIPGFGTQHIRGPPSSFALPFLLAYALVGERNSKGSAGNRQKSKKKIKIVAGKAIKGLTSAKGDDFKTGDRGAEVMIYFLLRNAQLVEKPIAGPILGFRY